MDMCVETSTLLSIASKLESCSRTLDAASNNLKNDVNRAGYSLEGRQYSLSVEATDSTCEIANACSSNLCATASYLKDLERAVNKYLSCKY